MLHAGTLAALKLFFYVCAMVCSCRARLRGEVRDGRSFGVEGPIRGVHDAWRGVVAHFANK